MIFLQAMLLTFLLFIAILLHWFSMSSKRLQCTGSFFASVVDCFALQKTIFMTGVGSISEEQGLCHDCCIWVQVRSTATCVSLIITQWINCFSSQTMWLHIPGGPAVQEQLLSLHDMVEKYTLPASICALHHHSFLAQACTQTKLSFTQKLTCYPGMYDSMKYWQPLWRVE